MAILKIDFSPFVLQKVAPDCEIGVMTNSFFFTNVQIKGHLTNNVNNLRIINRAEKKKKKLKIVSYSDIYVYRMYGVCTSGLSII